MGYTLIVSLEFGGLNASHILSFGTCQGGKSFDISRVTTGRAESMSF